MDGAHHCRKTIVADQLSQATMNANATPITKIDEPGVRAEGQLLMQLRQEVAQLLGRSQIGFPGAQPVSFSRRHLQELMTKE